MLNLNSRDPFEAIWRRETRHETESKNNKNITTNPIDKQNLPEEHFRRRKGAEKGKERELKRQDRCHYNLSCLEALHHGLMPYSFVLRRGFRRKAEMKKTKTASHSPRFIVAL